MYLDQIVSEMDVFSDQIMYPSKNGVINCYILKFKIIYFNFKIMYPNANYVSENFK